jgi:hypothetical protein
MTFGFTKNFNIRYPDGWELKGVFMSYDNFVRKLAEGYIDDNGVCPLDFYELMLNELHENKCKHCIEYI